MPDLAALRAALRSILPQGAGVGATDPLADHPLWPGETVPGAIPRRLREFAAGRAAARKAMAEIGTAPCAVPMQHDRSPAWPAGIGGSITHAATVCLAAALRGGHPGIDLEPDDDLPRDTRDIVLTARERTFDGRSARAVFCAKEAFYKAQYPITERLIGFDAVEVGLAGNGFTVTLCIDLAGWRAGHVISGRLAAAQGHILASVVLPMARTATQA